MRRKRRSWAPAKKQAASQAVIDQALRLIAAHRRFDRVWQAALRETATTAEAKSVIEASEAELAEELQRFERLILGEAEAAA